MKKSKKILSLFLAMLMVMTCFSAISASAITNEQAEAQLAAWNDSRVDLSGVYADMSEKQAKSTMTALDTALAAVLKQADVRAKLYSDSGAGNLIVTLSKLIHNAMSNVGGGGIALDFTPDMAGTGLGMYPEVSDYLMSCTSWDEVDSAKLVFGIEAGNAMQFREVICAAMGNLVIVVALFGDIAISGLLETFHTGTAISLQDAMSQMAGDTDAEMYQSVMLSYLAPIFDAIEMFFAHPVEYLCDILPDLAYSYDNVLATALEGMLPPLSQVLGDLLGSLTETTGVKFPAIDVNKLTHMGTAKIVDSTMALDLEHSATMGTYLPGYRVQIDANKPMVFAAVAQYACNVLRSQENQIAIGRLVVGLVGEEYQADYDAIVDAALSGSNLAIADACLDLFEKVANKNVEQGGVAGFFAKVTAFFVRIGKLITSIFKIF